jgi:hypothetical protein
MSDPPSSATLANPEAISDVRFPISFDTLDATLFNADCTFNMGLLLDALSLIDVSLFTFPSSLRSFFEDILLK